MKIEVSPRALRIDDREPIDPRSPDAVTRLQGVLGQPCHHGHVGVRGSGIAGMWFDSGVVAVVSDDGIWLRDLCVCFDAAPWPEVFRLPRMFDGEVVCLGHAFRGGAPAREVESIPGLEGFRGHPSVSVENLLVAFYLERKRAPNGKRTGRARYLEMIDILWWAGLRFPSGEPRASE